MTPIDLIGTKRQWTRKRPCTETPTSSREKYTSAQNPLLVSACGFSLLSYSKIWVENSGPQRPTREFVNESAEHNKLQTRVCAPPERKRTSALFIMALIKSAFDDVVCLLHTFESTHTHTLTYSQSTHISRTSRLGFNFSRLSRRIAPRKTQFLGPDRLERKL
jgi:hypothetical protein